MTRIKTQIHIVIENEQVVTTSRNIADNFGKQHKHVIESIEKLLKEDGSNFRPMFKKGSEPDSYGRKQKVYYMNRDGFSFLAMGFTGSKAREFKLAYIEQFNQMEAHINRPDTSQLSPELQMFNQIFHTVANNELKTKQLENKVDNISALMTLDAKDWRKEMVTILRKIAIKQGGMDKYSEITNESYVRLEAKARCNLNTRLENRKKNMIAQGLGKTTVKRLNKLDIIEADHRLKQIYISVVKDMAIKYKVWSE